MSAPAAPVATPSAPLAPRSLGVPAFVARSCRWANEAEEPARATGARETKAGAGGGEGQMGRADGRTRERGLGLVLTTRPFPLRAGPSTKP